ncbi:protein of unknown function [Nitrosospira sp. Nsp11]|uniref:DUF4224 domain-containing protein n=1 Tax=Nitrosospira sp. Nsp11 TaxID=1855338 RepID=UPI0009121E51|nr:DUF4224 domain-containing protein [Nitrosospira sp. Nsp11]SHM04806.1 protein of unknown function [Nitrosospira sp. Nsp11]
MFLTPEEVAVLTGIARGRDGKTREQLQVAQLRDMGIAFRVNAKGRPITTWAAVNGVKENVPPPPVWQSNILKLTKTA